MIITERPSKGSSPLGNLFHRRGVTESDKVKVYCSNARSILEYASAVFASLSPCDAMAAKRMQTHTLAIIFIFPAFVLV